MKVATQHAEAIGEGAGNGVEEWFLLNGVALHAADVSPRNIKLAATVVSDLADAGLAFRNGAGVSAGVAAQTVPIQWLDQLGRSLAHVGIQNVFEGRHLKRILLR
jgi:hypothetical protein